MFVGPRSRDGAPRMLRVAVTVGALLAVACTPGDPAAPPDEASRVLPACTAAPGWAVTGSMRQAREAHTLTVLASGHVLAVGGLYGDGAATAAVEGYDPGTGAWTSLAPLSTPRWAHVAARLPDGKVLVAGGFDGTDTIIATTARYDPVAGTWSPTAPLGRSRAGAAAAVLADGRILVVGGTSQNLDTTTPRSAEVYDPATGTWTPTGLMLRSRPNGHTATPLADGRVLVVGGDGGSGVQSELYDPATNSFGTGRTPIVPGRTRHTATRLADGRVLLTGGMTSSGVTPRVELYDPASHAWSETGSLSTPRREHVAVLQADGSVLVAAGVGERSGDLWATSEVFHPPQGTWGPGPSLSEPLANPSAVLLAQGQVLLSGGKNLSGARPTAALLAGAFCPVASSEYQLPLETDPRVTTAQQVQYWARLYRPEPLTPGKRHPLVVFIHGRHPPCGTGSNPRIDDQGFVGGACPAGYTEVPNHAGYGYLAEELARRGILSLSVNWNRLYQLPDPDGDDALFVGPLVLQHLVKLTRWNAGTEPTPASLGVSLTGQIDFANVILVGHSRGGPISFYVRDQVGSWSGLAEPVTIKGLFSIGAVDSDSPFQRREPRAAASVFLIPMCDRDGGHSAMAMFDRLLMTQTARPESNPKFKATYTVWGANHNFYNTEWQQSESLGCSGHSALFDPAGMGSAVQRQTAVRALVAFALGTLGSTPDATLAGLFDPVTFRESEWPRIDRGYVDAVSPAYSRELENFSRPTGTNMTGVANASANISLTHTTVTGQPGMFMHPAPYIGEPGFRFARITWTTGGVGTYFQAHFASPGTGIDLSGFSTLDFRVERVPESALNSSAFPTWFEVQLVGPSGALSNRVPMLSRARLTEPVGGAGVPLLKYLAFLQTVRIPLGSFTGVPLTSVRGVRFTFSGSSSGALYLADVRAGRPAP